MKKENDFLKNKMNEMIENKNNIDIYGETDYNKRKNFSNKNNIIKLEEQINKNIIKLIV